MSDLLQDFHTAIVQQAKQTLGNQLQADLHPIQAGTQGDFPWFWRDANGNFNKNTFDYISRRATPGTSGVLGPVALPDSFLNAYSQAINDLNWKLSSADQALVNATQLKTQVQAGNLVSTYEQNIGTITADNLAEAKAALGIAVNKLDYVVSYAVGYVWSGAAAKKGQPLTRQQMAAERHLAAKLPALPASGDPVLQSLVSYLANTASIQGLLDSVTSNQWLLNALKLNLESASSDNGGMTTVDSNGQTADNVGYKLDKVPTSILAGLTSGSSLKIAMQASRQSASQLQVNISGDAAGIIPLDFVSIGLGGSASYSLFDAQGSGASCSIEMEFPGVTLVSVQPTMFTLTDGKGWLYSAILAQAVRNADQDVTGWHFSPQPPYNFGAGGNFGMLASLVICGYPTIRITYTSGDYKQFSQTFQQNSSVEVKLFGIRLGGIKQSMYRANSSSDSQSNSFTLTLNPPDPTLAVAPLDQLAYVLGGVIQYPGDGSLAAMKRAALAVTGGQAMVALGGVSFTNSSGGDVEVYTSQGFKGTVTDIAPFKTSGPLSGKLLTIDVVRSGQRYSYDLTPFQPKGLLVEDESPYTLKQVLGTDGKTLELVISDNSNSIVGSIRPSMALV